MAVQENLKYRFQADTEGFNLDDLLSCLEENGFAVLENVFDEQLCKKAHEDLLSAHNSILERFSKETLLERREYSMVRLPMLYSEVFYEFLENDSLDYILTNYISEDVIVRNYSGQFIFSNQNREENLDPYSWYHRNHRHIKNCPGSFIDILIPFKDLELENGVVLIVPGSHKWTRQVRESELESQAIPVTVDTGSILFTDGMIWHREKGNLTKGDVPMVIVQYAPAVVKQHIDYPRALGDEVFAKLSPRLRKYFGWNSRVPSSLEEYFKPLDERLYQSKLPFEEKLPE